MTKTDEERIDELIQRRLDARTPSIIHMDEMDWLEHKRKQAGKKVKASQKRLTQAYHELRQTEMPTNPWGQVIYWLDRAHSLAQGAQMGYKVGDAVSMIFSMWKWKKKNQK